MQMTSYIIQKRNVITGEWFTVTVPFRYYMQAGDHISDLREGNEYAHYRVVRRTTEDIVLSV